MSNQLEDPVLTSVAAYSANPVGYEQKYETHLLDRPARFLSLLPPAARILDLGCGPGRDLRLFTEAGRKPIGIELNPSFAEMARRHGSVLEADIRNIEDIFPPLTFEGVWAQASLVHLSMSDTEQVLQKALNLLVPAGRFYACVPAVGENGWRNEVDGQRWYTVWPDDSFPTAIEAAGFQVDDVTMGPYVEVWASKR
jgi:SAM-dependent methyltransferase